MLLPWEIIKILRLYGCDEYIASNLIPGLFFNNMKRSLKHLTSYT